MTMTTVTWMRIATTTSASKGGQQVARSFSSLEQQKKRDKPQHTFYAWKVAATVKSSNSFPLKHPVVRKAQDNSHDLRAPEERGQVDGGGTII